MSAAAKRRRAPLAAQTVRVTTVTFVTVDVGVTVAVKTVVDGGALLPRNELQYRAATAVDEAKQLFFPHVLVGIEDTVLLVLLEA